MLVAPFKVVLDANVLFLRPNGRSRGGPAVNLSCRREVEILSDFGTPEEGLEPPT